MVSNASFKVMALSFAGTSEEPHFQKRSFRVKKKIFATLDESKKQASLKLSAIDQSVYCDASPAAIYPAAGAWGKQGWTIIHINQVPKSLVEEALRKAYDCVLKKS